jgi:glyoxylase-like metal-dependent hydrolase (beta-lactamase superfamily II)/ferredoxin
MASLVRRLADNVPGDFYVDETCIDCDTCRRIEPSVFVAGNGYSYVGRQPESEKERHRSLMALVACPTGSIGTVSRTDAHEAIAAYPERVAENVSFCGFTSQDSFGAWSYLVERPEGNVLVDSPRAVNSLVKEMERRGGVALLFLTHRDDVADHAAFAKKFGAVRVLHGRDVTADTRDVERKLAGDDPISLAPDLVAIPVPGHTRGHAVLLYRERFLFTGDHLAWSPRRRELTAFRDACWYSWSEQIHSMERLLDFRFEWVLPGHGWRYHARSAEAMRTELEKCVRWMKSR